MKELDVLSALALQVAEQKRNRDDAVHQERLAAAKLLEVVVERVRPALPALVSPVIKAEESSNDADYPGTATTYVHEDANMGNPTKRAEGVLAGTKRDEKLYLLDSGWWLRQEIYTTSFPDWDSQVYFIKEYDVLCNGWRSEDIIESLTKALQSQLNGASEKRTVSARERAAKLNEALAKASATTAPLPPEPSKISDVQIGPTGTASKVVFKKRRAMDGGGF